MTDPASPFERFAEADRLLATLLTRPADEREAVLTELRPEDPELGPQVAELLRLANEGDALLVEGGALAGGFGKAFVNEGVALGGAAPQEGNVAPDSPASRVSTRAAGRTGEDVAGQRVGPWRIVRELGRGGMAVVYLAERADGAYEQQVALKLLRAGPQAAELVGRFERERQILASLRHPHIAGLIDGGVTADGQPWFTMEYVDGVPVDRYCDRRRLNVDERLALFLLIARTVQAAHRARVVHRDLKPSNILVTDEGLPGLLDFGIARPFDPQAGSAEVTRTLLLLTPEYASPEQIRGAPATAASDIYQLGLLLYELLTGRRAQRLERASPTELERVVTREIPPLPSRVASEADDVTVASRRTTSRSLSRRLRGDLDAIVMTALRKEPQHRYASAADLVADVESHLAGRPVRARSETWRSRTRRFLARHRPGLVAATAGAGLAVVAIALSGILTMERGGASRPRYPFQRYDMRQLTSIGNFGGPALTPDGRLVIYSEVQGLRRTLRSLHLQTGEEREIPLPAGFTSSGLKVAADGQHVYFSSPSPEPGEEGHVLYRLSLAGGEPAALATGLPVAGGFAIDPGGRQVAFVRTDAVHGDSRLIVVDLRTGRERVVATRPVAEPYEYPAWSPDGRLIALTVGSPESYDEASSLVVVSVADGTETLLSEQKWQYVAHKSWLPGDRGIIFRARRTREETHLWLLGRDDRSIRQLTRDPFPHAGSFSLDARGHTLVTLRSVFIGDLWVMAAGRTAGPRRLTVAQASPIFLLDGQIAYLSPRHVRRIRIDGTSGIRLPIRGKVVDMRSGPDGRWIVFSASRSGPTHIWRAAADGTDARQLTNGDGEKFADIAPDGRWITYVAVPEFTLWRTGVDGGPAIRLLGPYVRTPAISPDGRWIACAYKPKPYAPWRIVVIPTRGGAPVQELPVRGVQLLDWSPDGKAIDYVADDQGVENLWRIPLAGGEPAQLTHFDGQRIGGFVWSQDEERLAVVRGAWQNQVLLLRDRE